MLNIDKFQKTGRKHAICEDAVIIGDNPFPYLIVSDGCSSSEDTHIGSNILAKSAEYIFKNELYKIDLNTNFANDLGLMIINRSWNIAKLIPLNKNSLDATLLISFIINNQIYFIIYGDGNLLYNQNNIDVFKKYDHSENKPDYLSYFLDNKRKNLYCCDVLNQIKKCEKNTKSSFVFNINHFEYTVEKYSIENMKYFIISTDGISSFSNSLIYLDYKNLNVGNFKNYNGVYLQRKMNKILKEKEKELFYNFDDLGIASFLFEENYNE